MTEVMVKPRRPLDWQEFARCRDSDPEIFYPERGRSSRAAKTVCAACPVQAACLAFALKGRETFGIWGGRSERERRRLKHLADEPLDVLARLTRRPLHQDRGAAA